MAVAARYESKRISDPQETVEDDRYLMGIGAADAFARTKAGQNKDRNVLCSHRASMNRRT